MTDGHTRGRAVFTRLNTAVAVLLPFAFLGALYFEWSDGVASSRVRIDFDRPSQDVSASIVIADVHHDESLRRIVGTVEIDLIGARPDVDIREASFNVLSNADGSVDWTPSSRCTRIDGETAPPDNGPTVQSVRLVCGRHTLNVPDPAVERRYPFDTYAITLQPIGCVNHNDCSNSTNIDFTDVTLMVSDRQLVPRGVTAATPAVIALERPFVIRVLSVAFAIIAVFFLFNLVRVSDRKDVFGKSLGFFATLWGLRALIVPSKVSAFPTAVDYTILALYCCLFAIVLYRLPQPEVKP